jgi:hypothetical protein
MRAWDRSALPKCVLLIALAIVPIGCDGKVHNKISVPENPAPRPDPSSRLEFGESAKTQVTAPDRRINAVAEPRGIELEANPLSKTEPE